MHCLLLNVEFALTNQVLFAQESKAKCLRLTNLKAETAIHPWITEVLNKSYGKSPTPSKKAAE